jgi:hypothetical protein
MSVGIGSKSTLHYVIETAYGVFPSTPTGISIGFNSETLQNSRNTFKSDEVNSSRMVTAIRSGNVMAAGDIVMEFSPNLLGTFFKHLLCCTPVTTTITPTTLTNSHVVTRGSYYKDATNTYLCTRSGTAAADITTTGALTSVDNNEEVKSGTAYFQFYAVNATAIYQHVFTAAATKPTGGFSIERKAHNDAASQYFRYIGGRINTWALNVPQEGIVTNTFGFIFLDLDSVAASTIWSGTTPTSDEPFAGSQTVIQLKAPAGSYVDNFTLSTLSLNVTNNYDANVYTIGQKRKRDLPEGRREISGSFTAFFEDLAIFNYFMNESTVGVKVGSNGRGQFAEIEMPTVKFTGGTPAPVVSGNGTLSSQFNMEAFSSAGGADIVVTLRNSTASYP